MASGCPALVLAAGASQRLGQPKALVEVGSTTLVGLAVKRLLDAGCSPVVVVTRQELQFDVMLQSMDATVVVNADPDAGRTGTCLLYTSPSPRDGLLSRMPSSA